MASGSKQSSFIDFAAGTDPTLTVITADGGRIPAHNEVLRLVSRCFRDCPASDTWDLSSLLVNGSPVRQSTVTAVLSVVYSGMGVLGYELDCTGQYSLTQLFDMLWFADAVGCSKALLCQLAGLMGSSVRAELECNVVSSNSKEDKAAADAEVGAAGSEPLTRLVTLKLDASYKFARVKEGMACVRPGPWALHRVERNYMKGSHYRTSRSWVVKTLSAQQKTQLRQQLPQQLEALLFVGFRLHVPQLQKAALRFLDITVRHLMHGPWWADEAIFSHRVLDAAGSASGAELLRRSGMAAIVDGCFP